jgi:hypothetical protein
MPNNFKTVVNFRDGIQVDNDDIVSSNGFVGIGSTLPRDTLDVRGNTIVDGNVTASTLNVSGVNTLGTIEGTTLTISGVTSIGNLTVDSAGIVTSVSGVLTYYGDGGRLLNLPTSQWLDVDAGLGFTSIYAQGDVGIGTTNPQASLQIGASILADAAAGVVTASVFEGTRLPEEFEAFRGRASAATTATNAETLIGTPDITVDNIVGASASITGFVTATNSLSVGSAFQANAGGIVTATTFVGALDGNAATATVATNVETGADLVITSIASTASSLKPFQLFSNGLSTFTGNLAVVTSLGVGTPNPNPAYALDVIGTANVENLQIDAGPFTNGTIVINGQTGFITGGNVIFETGISTFSTVSVANTMTVSENLTINAGTGAHSLEVLGSSRLTTVGVGTSAVYDFDVLGNSFVAQADGFLGVGTVPAGGAGATGLEVLHGIQAQSGIITGREGFISDAEATEGVKITVSGSTLTFTVDGVGSVDLTLT